MLTGLDDRECGLRRCAVVAGHFTGACRAGGPRGARGEPMARQSLPDAEVPDPGRINSQQDFGRELTLARQQAGLTIRDVAKASGIPVSTVGDYFAARHLPPARQPELLPSILAACQITKPEQVARWLDALNRVRRAPGRPPAGPAPYRGLASFQPEDAAWFFGREELALHLVRLATAPSAPGLPLAVVGPSGSGKSSLLRAGLVPRLRAGTPSRPGGRQVVLITPGAGTLMFQSLSLGQVRQMSTNARSSLVPVPVLNTQTKS